MSENKEDQMCRCGHLHSQHRPKQSINYTAGRCTIANCDCENFIIMPPPPKGYVPTGSEAPGTHYDKMGYELFFNSPVNPKDIPSPEKEGASHEMPEEIAQWIEQEVQRQTIDFENWHGVDQISAGGYRIGAKKMAIAMYHHLMEGNTEAYWFEKAREVLVERNDFKGQLSEMTRMRDVAKTEYERWKKESDDLSAIIEAKNLENAQLREVIEEIARYADKINGLTWETYTHQIKLVVNQYKKEQENNDK